MNATFHGSRYNGIARFTDRLVECLQLAGHELVIYTSSNRYEGIPRTLTRPSPPSLTTDAGPRASFKRFAWMQTVLPGRLKADGVELLICPSVEGVLTSPVPQIITVHDLIPLLYREENPVQYHFYKHVLPRILRKARLIIAVSQHTKADLVRIYGVRPERVAVATSGVELEAPGKTGRNPAAPYFLYLGTFSPRKNLETVIRAFAKVAPDLRESLVVVAYPDRWQPEIVKLAEELKILDRIIFKCALPVEELADLYCGATALVLLSEYEGFGFPPLEAMLLGTPAIVSDATSLSEVAAEGAIRVAAKDVNAAADAMRTLSTDPAAREKYSQFGKFYAAKYAKAQCAARLKEVLAPILHNDGR